MKANLYQTVSATKTELLKKKTKLFNISERTQHLTTKWQIQTSCTQMKKLKRASVDVMDTLKELANSDD